MNYATILKLNSVLNKYVVCINNYRIRHLAVFTAYHLCSTLQLWTVCKDILELIKVLHILIKIPVFCSYEPVSLLELCTNHLKSTIHKRFKSFLIFQHMIYEENICNVHFCIKKKKLKFISKNYKYSYNLLIKVHP